MAEESDGIEEAFDGQLRVLITAAGRVGEAFARGREEAMRRAQAQSQGKRPASWFSSRFESMAIRTHRVQQRLPQRLVYQGDARGHRQHLPDGPRVDQR